MSQVAMVTAENFVVFVVFTSQPGFWLVNTA